MSWIEQKTDLFWARGNSTADDLCIRTTKSTLLWVSSLPAHPTDFGFANLNNHMSQFFIINFFLNYIHTSYWFHSSGEPWITQHVKKWYMMYQQYVERWIDKHIPWSKQNYTVLSSQLCFLLFRLLFYTLFHLHYSQIPNMCCEYHKHAKINTTYSALLPSWTHGKLNFLGVLAVRQASVTKSWTKKCEWKGLCHFQGEGVKTSLCNSPVSPFLYCSKPWNLMLNCQCHP